MKVWMLLSILAPSLFAAEAPLLSKKTQPTRTVPEWRITKSCDVYADRVVETREVNGLRTVTTQALSLSGDVEGLTAKAATGKVQKEIKAADVPTTYWIAGGGEGALTLQIKGGTELTNLSSEAKTLVNLLDQICR